MAGMPEILEEWRIVDRWWTEEPITKEYVEVLWNSRKIVLFRQDDDPVWHIWRNNG